MHFSVFFWSLSSFIDFNWFTKQYSNILCLRVVCGFNLLSCAELFMIKFSGFSVCPALLQAWPWDWHLNFILTSCTSSTSLTGSTSSTGFPKFYRFNKFQNKRFYKFYINFNKIHRINQIFCELLTFTFCFVLWRGRSLFNCFWSIYGTSSWQ